MATATQKRTEAQPVFVSRSDNLRVVRAPLLRETVAGGAQKSIAPGLAYEFEGHRLVVTEKMQEADRWFFDKYGEHYPPEAAGDTADWLRKRAAETGDFYEIAVSPPPSGDTLQEVAALAIDGDTDGLVELREAEEQGHNRPDVLAAADHALRKLEERQEAP